MWALQVLWEDIKIEKACFCVQDSRKAQFLNPLKNSHMIDHPLLRFYHLGSFLQTRCSSLAEAQFSFALPWASQPRDGLLLDDTENYFPWVSREVLRGYTQATSFLQPARQPVTK